MKRVFKIIIINILVLAGLLILLELAYRVTGTPFRMKETPPEGFYSRFDPELGWSYIPNKDIEWEFGDPKRAILLHFDAEGIRVPESDFHFDPERPTVLFIGGSFTMGHGVLYYEAFPGRLESAQGMPLQSVNLGVQGYGTDQAFLRLKQMIEKFNTKWVVYTFIPNHIQRNGNYDRRMLYRKSRFPGTKPYFKLDENGKLYLAKMPCLYRYYLNSYFLDNFKINCGERLGIFPPRPKDVTEALIRRMQELSRAHGAEFTVVDWYLDDEDAYEFIKNLEGVDVIRTKEKMPEWEDLRIPGDGHPSPEAHKRVAAMLFSYFQENRSDILDGK